MKEKFLKALPYICAVSVAIALILVDIVKNNNEYEDYLESQEEYAKTLVESSEVRYNGQNYHGVYESEEVSSIGEDFILVGSISEMKEDSEELTEDFTSHILPDGYGVYASKENTNIIYVDITVEGDGDDIKTYIPYMLYE